MAADNGGLNYWPKVICGYPRDPWLIKFGLHFSSLFIVYIKELIKNPSSTFYGRVKGLSMIEAGVDDRDLW
jgi:hypothetical protein